MQIGLSRVGGGLRVERGLITKGSWLIEMRWARRRCSIDLIDNETATALSIENETSGQPVIGIGLPRVQFSVPTSDMEYDRMVTRSIVYFHTHSVSANATIRYDA